MKYKTIYFLIYSLSLASCHQNETKNEVFKKDRFIIPSLPGDYEPEGLRKLSIVEMKKLTEDFGLPSGMVYKDNKGNVVPKDYYSSGPEPRIMQFYMNSAGKVEVAVVHELTPELKAMFMLMRIATLPLDN